MDIKVFTLLNKVWLLLHLFSCNSQSFSFCEHFLF